MTERIVKKRRCAVYCRKSSEEGLEQEFNSLHAQREAASRQKGTWMGEVPPYGYRVETRKLLVDEETATHVRWIFARFLEIGSATLPVDRRFIGAETQPAIAVQSRIVAGERLPAPSAMEIGRPGPKTRIYPVNSLFFSEVLPNRAR